MYRWIHASNEHKVTADIVITEADGSITKKFEVKVAEGTEPRNPPAHKDEVVFTKIPPEEIHQSVVEKMMNLRKPF